MKSKKNNLTKTVSTVISKMIKPIKEKVKNEKKIKHEVDFRQAYGE
jgi:hypothetical protein